MKPNARLREAFVSDCPALISYLTVGYPSVEATKKLVPLLAAAGCDVIELGIPFSDPLADGATIQKASHQALLNGVTPSLCLKLAGELRAQTDVALVFMTYYNLVLNHGIAKFCIEAATNGVDGLIIPDLTADEGTELEQAANDQGIDLVYLLAPTSTEDRIRLVASRSRGFIYMVSLTGVTGARQELSADIEDFVARVRAHTATPLAVGFGISTPEQAARVARVADGVIVGSRLLQLAELDGDGFEEVVSFTRSLKGAIRGARGDRR